MRKGPAAGLRATATAEYHRLGVELPELPVTWSGSLSWTREDSAPDAGPGQTIVDAATWRRSSPPFGSLQSGLSGRRVTALLTRWA